MGASLAKIGAITLFVEDLAQAKRFYLNVFDLPVLFEDENSVAFKFDNTIINLLVVSEAPDLIAPAAVANGGSGSRFQLTIWVADADATCEDLKRRGVALINGPTDRAWGVRTACFADPGGHIWEIAQQLPPK